MSVMRINKTRDYTVMSNYHLRDMQLSLKAKGLLSVMLSLPDEWNYSISGLVSICKENETAIKSALNELKQSGYVVVTKSLPGQTKSGRIEYIYDIYEEPQRNTKQEGEKQGVENLGVEFLSVENMPLYKYTNILNTKESNTDILNTDTDAFNPSELKGRKKQEQRTEPDASFPEAKEAYEIKLPSKTAYTQKELKAHITSKIRELYVRETGELDDRAEELIEIILYFYDRYHFYRKEKHPILSDMAYKKIVLSYLCPPEIMYEHGEWSFDAYRKMIDKYFKTNFGKRSEAPVGFNYRICHFMSDNIREHLYLQTCV